MLRNLAFKMERYFPEMKEYLQQADIKMLVPTYLQKVLTYSLIVTACSFMPLFLFLFMILNFDILVSFLISLAFLPVFFSISLFFGVSYPKSRASSRRQSIEANLPFAITHMSTIAASGVSPTNIFKLISEFKEYGELAKECEKVVKNVELFGLDITSALREVGRRRLLYRSVLGKRRR
jgi:flagellar protein FlaJ